MKVNDLATAVSPKYSGSRFSLESASVGRVGLIVSDVQRSLEFYAGVIGLHVLSQTPHFAQLGVAEENRVLLELEQRPDVRPLRGKRLGLYHAALLLPSRAALTSFANHLSQREIYAGSSDHLVSEAFYLRDPDGLELEVYADRARNVWPWRGEQLELATLPLNFADLFLTPHTAWKGVPPGTSIGHMHFYIGDLKRAERIYREGLGMNVRTQGFPGALFLAAGDYHHHVGLNTWAGSVPSASEADARLGWWELCVPDRQLSALQGQMRASGWQPGPGGALVDPWGISVRLTSHSER